MIKILSYKSPQRYAVRQTLKVAQKELQKKLPGFEIQVEELKTLEEIEQYTPVVILPSLVVDEKLVCVGRFPKKFEIVGWLQDAQEGNA
jgi:hypothetical protein